MTDIEELSAALSDSLDRRQALQKALQEEKQRSQQLAQKLRSEQERSATLQEQLKSLSEQAARIAGSDKELAAAKAERTAAEAAKVQARMDRSAAEAARADAARMQAAAEAAMKTARAAKAAAAAEAGRLARDEAAKIVARQSAPMAAYAVVATVLWAVAGPAAVVASQAVIWGVMRGQQAAWLAGQIASGIAWIYAALPWPPAARIVLIAGIIAAAGAGITVGVRKAVRSFKKALSDLKADLFSHDKKVAFRASCAAIMAGAFVGAVTLASVTGGQPATWPTWALLFSTLGTLIYTKVYIKA